MKNYKKSKKAFSLIELSIVLIIIGIIISAVMNSGDIIKSGESKQFYQTFARKWTTVLDSYYDRMGSELGDSSLHGGIETTKDGYFDGIVVEVNTIENIKNSGINLDRVITTNQDISSKYIIEGEDSGYQIVEIYLGAYILNDTRYNFMILKNIPIDIALTIDRYVDSVSDGKDGNAIAIQKSVTDNTLPDNLSDITSLGLGYSEINTVTKTTNLGIMLEH
ncbi:MAG: prepilin-type N-terminal cleavage/methylation domain-containing protein [Campylobacterota bacterium]|nr:prepilin-type N-terminal cleavage/methylation domain-containing protein [Campylobacterota bacterium]